MTQKQDPRSRVAYSLPIDASSESGSYQRRAVSIRLCSAINGRSWHRKSKNIAGFMRSPPSTQYLYVEIFDDVFTGRRDSVGITNGMTGQNHLVAFLH